MGHGPRSELEFTVRCSQRRRAAQHDQVLLRAVMEVVRHAVGARWELPNSGSQRSPCFAHQTLSAHPVPELRKLAEDVVAVLLAHGLENTQRNPRVRRAVQPDDGSGARPFHTAGADHDLERRDCADRRGDGVRVLRRCRDEGFPARAARTRPRTSPRHRDPPERRRGDSRPARRRRVRPQPRRGRLERRQPRRLRGRAAHRVAGARGRGARRRRANEREMTAEADLERVRGLVGGALASLETSRGRIDDLNVYPVPDGDTGTNLTLTVRAVADAVAAAEEADRPALARAVARAALMGARGTSGVILSQIVRGVADVLAEATNGDDPQLAARALRGASDAAYRAVRRPVEGTMLTVIRELAEEAERRVGEPEPPGDLLVELVRHGEGAVARTPKQLDILREAGVVDAGGAGLVELLRGVAGAVTGLGDKTAIKVHVHTDDPGAALSLGTAAGTVEGVEIANMHEQQEQRERRLSVVPSPLAACGVLAVVAGDGNRLLFETLAEPVGTIRVVTGGQTANPSTAELVAALEELRADAAIVLPHH